MCASDHVTMNFGVDYVTKNNLGGEGPDTEDEEMLRIDMIGTTSTGSYIALEIRALAFGENLIDANNGDHADTVADDLNNKVIARFLDEV